MRRAVHWSRDSDRGALGGRAQLHAWAGPLGPPELPCSQDSYTWLTPGGRLPAEKLVCASEPFVSALVRREEFAEKSFPRKKIRTPSYGISPQSVKSVCLQTSQASPLH